MLFKTEKACRYCKTLINDKKQPVAVFWFRRDLHLEDYTALFHALINGYPVLPDFVFDTNILDKLENKEDKRLILFTGRLEIGLYRSIIDICFTFEA